MVTTLTHSTAGSTGTASTVKVITLHVKVIFYMILSMFGATFLNLSSVATAQSAVRATTTARPQLFPATIKWTAPLFLTDGTRTRTTAGSTGTASTGRGSTT